jgi:hypothetical protein
MGINYCNFLTNISGSSEHIPNACGIYKMTWMHRLITSFSMELKGKPTITSANNHNKESQGTNDM